MWRPSNVFRGTLKLPLFPPAPRPPLPLLHLSLKTPKAALHPAKSVLPGRLGCQGACDPCNWSWVLIQETFQINYGVPQAVLGTSANTFSPETPGHSLRTPCMGRPALPVHSPPPQSRALGPGCWLPGLLTTTSAATPKARAHTTHNSLWSQPAEAPEPSPTWGSGPVRAVRCPVCPLRCPPTQGALPAPLGPTRPSQPGPPGAAPRVPLPCNRRGAHPEGGPPPAWEALHNQLAHTLGSLHPGSAAARPGPGPSRSAAARTAAKSAARPSCAAPGARPAPPAPLTTPPELWFELVTGSNHHIPQAAGALPGAGRGPSARTGSGVGRGRARRRRRGRGGAEGRAAARPPPAHPGQESP